MKKALFSSARKEDSSGLTGATSSSSLNIESSITSKTSNKTMGCCARLGAELKHPWFVVQEAGNTTKVIDVQRSFAPEPKRWVTSFKLILAVWAYQVLVVDLTNEAYNDGLIKYYLIYLTHWAFLAALLYFPLSLALSLCGNVSQPAESSSNNVDEPELQQPSFLVRFAWGLFSTTATLQVAVSLLFWLLEYNYDSSGMPSYTSIMKHGGIMVLLLIDGLVVNKIPVRAKHIVIAESVSLAYLLWTVVHSKLGIGNVFSEGEEEDEQNDDVIYSVINWKDSPEQTLIVVVLVVLVVVPMLFIILWAASQCRRRYVVEEGGDVEHGETGSKYYRMNTNQKAEF
jgi:hypothetical protein